MPAFDCPADLIHAKRCAEALEETIADIKGACFIQRDSSSLRKINRNPAVMLIVELCLFSGFFSCPFHQLILVTGELGQKIVELSHLFIDAEGRFAVFFVVGLIDIDTFVV